MLGAFAFFGVDETMVDVIVDQCPLGAGDGVLDRLELLRDVDAGPLFLDHPDDAAKMACRPVEPLDDRRMADVSIVGHAAM